MYYIQENLLNLMAKQKVEEEYLNDFEGFINVSYILKEVMVTC